MTGCQGIAKLAAYQDIQREVTPLNKRFDSYHHFVLAFPISITINFKIWFFFKTKNLLKLTDKI